jgi:hypothetical protein
MLQNMGLTIENRDKGLTTAHRVCIQFQQGQSKRDIVEWVSETQNIGRVKAGYVVDAATDIYCPQYSGPAR